MHILSIRTSSNTADISDLKWSVAALHDHLPRWPRDPDQPLDHQLHPHRAPAILPPHQLLLDVCWRFVWSLIKLATLTDLFLGLYLFLQVQASFSVGRLKLRHCVSIGWGNNNNQSSQAFLTTSYPWAVSWPVAWHFLTNYPLVLGNFQWVLRTDLKDITLSLVHKIFHLAETPFFVRRRRTYRSKCCVSCVR